MPSLPPFDPLQVGAAAEFAFDLTEDIETAQLASTSWTCIFAPPPSGGGIGDPDPQSRVIKSAVATVIPTRQSDGALVNQTGFFTTALIGHFPPSSAGGSYLVTALTMLSDGRILGSSGSIPSFDPMQVVPLAIPLLFDRNAWVARFPEFESVSSDAAQGYFDEATLYHSNDGCGFVTDPLEQQTLLWLLTAHIAALYATHHGRATNEMVGRITNVTQGPVSLATALNADTPTEEWFMQTKYGFSYWTLTAMYRTMHYRVPRPRIYDPIYAGRAIGLGRTW